MYPWPHPTRLYLTLVVLMSSTTWKDAQFMLNPSECRYVAFSIATALVRMSDDTTCDVHRGRRGG